MAKKKYDIIAVGGATVDISFPAREGTIVDNRRDLLRQKLLAFEAGAKISIDYYRQSFGGGATNVAVNLAHSGFSVACLAAIGQDGYGRDIADNLKQKGVLVSSLQEPKGRASGASFIIVSDTGERLVFSYRGANDHLAVTAAAQEEIGRADWVYIATLSHDWKRVLPKIFSVSGPRFAWNPGLSQCQAGAQALSRYLRRTDMFALNRDEALELLLNTEKYKGQPRAFWDDIGNLLKAIFSFGPKLVVITDGPQGAYAYAGDRVYYQHTAKEKRRVDATGVGDRFNSSLLASLILSGGDIKVALSAASRCAAAKVADFGAQAGLVDVRRLVWKKKKNN